MAGRRFGTNEGLCEGSGLWTFAWLRKSTVHCATCHHATAGRSSFAHHYTALRCAKTRGALPTPHLHRTSKHCAGQNCAALHWTAPHATTLLPITRQFSTQHRLALSWATLYYTALHCRSLQYKTAIRCHQSRCIAQHRTCKYYTYTYSYITPAPTPSQTSTFTFAPTPTFAYLPAPTRTPTSARVAAFGGDHRMFHSASHYEWTHVAISA